MISPYHYRVDWQIWFAAMSSIGREPWLLHLIDNLKLLHEVASSPGNAASWLGGD